MPEIQYARDGGRLGPHSARAAAGGSGGVGWRDDGQARSGAWEDEEEEVRSSTSSSSAADNAVAARHGGSRRGRISIGAAAGFIVGAAPAGTDAQVAGSAQQPWRHAVEWSAWKRREGGDEERWGGLKRRRRVRPLSCLAAELGRSEV